MRRRNNGFALITLLWVATLLSVIALSALFSTRMDTRLTHFHVTNAKVRALADSGIFRGIYALTRTRADVTHGLPLPIDTLTLGEGRIDVAIENEAGKIDLNTAPFELVEHSIRKSGLSDGEQSGLLKLYRKVAGFNKENDPEQNSESSRFQSIDELIGQLYTNRSAYQFLNKALTTNSGLQAINPTVATPEAISSIPDISQYQISLLISNKNGNLAKSVGFGLADRFLTTRLSATYTIISTAQIDNSVSRIKAIVRMSAIPSNPYTILSWTETTST